MQGVARLEQAVERPAPEEVVAAHLDATPVDWLLQIRVKRHLAGAGARV
jgi:hypothetical protein